MVILRRMKGKEIVCPSCPGCPSKFWTSFLFFLPIDIPVYSIHIAYIYYIQGGDKVLHGQELDNFVNF